MDQDRIDIIRNTDRNINITLRDENGDAIPLDTATDIKACFKAESITSPVVLGLPFNEIQRIDFSTVPDDGVFRLTHEGNETVDILSSEAAIDVQNALNALSSLSGITVTGDFTNDFVITFDGSDGNKAQPTLIVSANTLVTGPTAVTVTVSVTQEGRKESIFDVNLLLGKFRIEMKKVDTLLLETGLGKDLEIQWIDLNGKCNGKQVKNIFDVFDSLCP